MHVVRPSLNPGRPSSNTVCDAVLTLIRGGRSVFNVVVVSSSTSGNSVASWPGSLSGLGREIVRVVCPVPYGNAHAAVHQIEKRTDLLRLLRLGRSTSRAC